MLQSSSSTTTEDSPPTKEGSIAEVEKTHENLKNKESKAAESVIDYATNTMNSFLSMYGYEERITTETLKSNIKTEPLSPKSKEVKSDMLAKGDGNSQHHQINAPKTATVMPMRSASPAMERKSISEADSSQRSRSTSSQEQPKLPSLPPKPITPYMRYRNQIFEEIKHKYPGCSPYDLATVISSKWSKLSDSERKVLSKKDGIKIQVWEDKFDDDMKEYNEIINRYYNIPSTATKLKDWVQEKKTPATNLLSFVENISLRIEPQSPARQLISQSQTKSSSTSSPREGSSSGTAKTTTTATQPPLSGLCHWCKRWSILQDFSTIIDGREIYCTGLCSEKCFSEASKQICSVESGNLKPKYVRNPRFSSNRRSGSDDGSRLQASSSISETASSIPLRGSAGSFDWDQYLVDTQSTAAPWMYFKQSREPPPNYFTVGMKLEASCNSDHLYAALARSLATVVSVSGPRILLHFDGAGASSDVWRLTDSEDIHPVGWTEGTQLRPPRGYKYEVSQYSNFYVSSLQNAEIAPARFFKKPPKTPPENCFSVGMKIEAVNRQNPAVIGVATVTNEEGDQIRIEFDGIKGLGYWCSYADRDIFPPGWCATVGHPLQPPPGWKNTPMLTRMPSSQDASTPPLSSVTSDASRTGSPFRSSSTIATIKESESRSNANNSNSSSSGSSSNNIKDKSSVSLSSNNVELFINSECYCGPYIDKNKFEMLRNVYCGSIVKVLKNVLEDTIKSAADPKTVFGFLKPGRGNCVITAVCDGVTYQCCLNSVDRVSKFWTVLEQFTDNLRCCTNVFSSTRLQAACSRCANNSGASLPTNPGLMKVTTAQTAQSYSGSRHSYSAPGRSRPPITSSHSLPYDYYKTSYRQDKSFDASSYSMVGYNNSPRSDNQPTTRHSMVRSDSVFEHSRQDSVDLGGKTSSRNEDESGLYDSEKDDVNVDGFDEPVTKKRKLQRNLAGGVEVSTAPKSWSIDDVINFIELTDLKDLKNKFKENEIDGKALLLLQRDLVLSHMGFKLGPAVKLLDLIEELRVAQKNLSPS